MKNNEFSYTEIVNLIENDDINTIIYIIKQKNINDSQLTFVFEEALFNNKENITNFILKYFKKNEDIYLKLKKLIINTAIKNDDVQTLEIYTDKNDTENNAKNLIEAILQSEVNNTKNKTIDFLVNNCNLIPDINYYDFMQYASFNCNKKAIKTLIKNYNPVDYVNNLKDLLDAKYYQQIKIINENVPSNYFDVLSKNLINKIMVFDPIIKAYFEKKLITKELEVNHKNLIKLPKKTKI
jgi:hypothetical protein